MIRKLLLHGLAFAAPFVIYLLYLRLARRNALAGGSWNALSGPWPWLFAAGLVLFVLSFVAYGLLSGDPAGRTYVPAHVEEGRVVPGRTVAPQAPRP